MKLIPIKERFADNTEFMDHPDCMESLEISVLYYANVGYRVPWIGYYVSMNNTFVGGAGFKGQPKNGKVEIAYGTFPDFQKMGIGTEMCRQLVALAQATDPTVRIMARTLMEENYSARILRKNNFQWSGVVVDPDDGEVWEWEYKKHY
ncbi:MAG: N-acetyltransferase [Marivirga sp.]|nr:N-acetyltransferase [Marivirga sp.]